MPSDARDIPDNSKDGFVGYSDSEMLDLVTSYRYGTIIVHADLACVFHMQGRQTATVWADMLNDEMKVTHCQRCHS